MRLSLEPRANSYDTIVRASMCVANRLVHARFIDDCHLVAHAIGHQLWQSSTTAGLLSSEAELALAASLVMPRCPGPQLCGAGCMHAVLISLVFAGLYAADPDVFTEGCEFEETLWVNPSYFEFEKTKGNAVS